MWEEKNNSLYKKFQFKNFSRGLWFYDKGCAGGEKKWIIIHYGPMFYNTVEVWLNTHDAGDIITDKDRKLSAKIDALI
jgi:4a-hydroxytetrahydrobiopterin dehydratase